MLFTSYQFVLVFLPATLIAVYAASALNQRTVAKVCLLVASLVFYAWWNPPYIAFLITLLAFNFVVGSRLVSTAETAAATRGRKVRLVFGLAANIGALLYFKYTNFLVNDVAAGLGLHYTFSAIVFPLGISFIVFQKIAFLVDAYSGEIKRLDPLDYGLFVSFFPQLISGPIVHHREVFPQFESPTSLRYSPRVVPIAITFLVFGAFKKIVIADSMSKFVGAGFQLVALGQHHDLIGAWLTNIAYTLQIYFDFSGYSDMAIGLGLLFGIRLPFNFNSPLKAHNIIDFWSRWHMTLTRFLTAYIFNPIVMRLTRRRLRARKRMSANGAMLLGAFVTTLAIPTLFTFFIAGLWHGAGFQFIAFGLVHGVYLVVNHAWRNLRRSSNVDEEVEPSRWGVVVARVATFTAIVVASPLFRADSVHSAASFLASMVGANGITPGAHRGDGGILLLVAAALFAVQILPNSQEVLRDRLEAATPALEKHSGQGEIWTPSTFSWPRLSWRPNRRWAIAIAVAAWIVLLLMAAPSEFLYFQF